MNTLGETYRHILETMNDGVLALSEKGRVTLFNQAAATILGRTQEQALGSSLYQLFFSEDGRNDEFIQTVLEAVYAKGSSLRMQAAYSREDGKTLYLEISSSYLEPGDDQFKGVVLVIRDITELRTMYEEEKRLTTSLSEAYRELEANTASLHDSVRRKRFSRILGVGLGLAALLALGAFVLSRQTPLSTTPPQEQTEAGSGQALFRVEPRPVSLQISLTGSIEPLDTVNVVSPFSGRVLSKMFVFGQEVEKNEALLELDTSELRVKLREAESAMIKAQQEYDKLRDWEQSDEVSSARRNYVKARKALETNRDKLKSSEDLLRRGIIPQDEHETLRVQFENQELDYLSAAESLEAALHKGSEDYVRIAAMSLENARFTLDSVQKQIDRAIVRAPVNGLVVRPKEGGGKEFRPLEVGRTFSDGEILLALGNMEGLTVRSKVDEVDMIRLQLGQQARITGDAFPGLTLEGVVKSISAQAVAPLQGSGAATFDVVVLVENLTPEQRHRLRLGMMAAVEITVYDNPEALLVPIPAVRGSAGEHYVLVRTPAGPERREVTLGITTLDAVEVLQGLAPGESILPGGS